jgi:Na+-driven multidrug efflux pump
VALTRALTARMLRWGLLGGVVTGVGLAALSPALGVLFTGDPAVRAALVPVLVVAAVFQPVAGVVFVLDGVLIGAGDGRYLAWGGVVVLAVFAPAAYVAQRAVGTLPALWVAFGVGFMAVRAVVLLHRAHGSSWLVTGPGRRAG